MFFMILHSFVGVALTVIIVSYAFILFGCKRKATIKIGISNSEQNYHRLHQAPGPHPWPIIGNLDIVGRFKNPFEGFGAVAKQYGDIYTLTLGQTRCLIVNNLEIIREVLNKNGKFFGGRPDFLRYHKLFGGDRNNSLALCDWSMLQQKRRNLARRHCSPRESSSYFTKMSRIGGEEIKHLMEKLEKTIQPGEPFNIKPLILKACANMFSQYMCSLRFNYEDTEFQQIVQFFDEIFWEINQGYPLDFLPWLLPFYKNHTKKICDWSTTIRKFILDRVINQRESNIDIDEPDNDFTDVLLKSLREDKNVSRNTIIFMLEDFIGGHSAVGNLVMLCLAYIAKDPVIGKNIQNEVDFVSNNGQRSITLHDMNEMPYTMATIFEVLRYSSSPIVPHVATEDTQISGYGVTSGSIVFINNYELNMSHKYWTNPNNFEPERFLEEKIKSITMSSKLYDIRRCSEASDSGIEIEKETGTYHASSKNQFCRGKAIENLKRYGHHRLQLKKNIPHFLPFSIGKRTCIGQNLVRGFGFIMLANIVQSYNINSTDLSNIIINSSTVALPATTFPLVLTPRM
ncbi:cytochrome P450 307a1-like [Drosophila sulfurigaster albostrigata]|uniref:cytochrome P450 307a1-like n=1 Tax=Drosophila sulfurigaster albostrigata TaxID=89887 RepID=UPI002D21B831|nr:cytochrome P450 307a1-like [Drosophila sulfurigaster albostrigata]